MQVLLDVSITNPSTYQMILRYTNPNPTPVKGEVSMEAPANVDSGDALTVTHHVVLPPTGGQVANIFIVRLNVNKILVWYKIPHSIFQLYLQPAFVTVSGDKGIYVSPFDLTPGVWPTSVKIDNTEPEAKEVLVVRFNCIY